jgi:hypothetical protein
MSNEKFTQNLSYPLGPSVVMYMASTPDTWVPMDKSPFIPTEDEMEKKVDKFLNPPVTQLTRFISMLLEFGQTRIVGWWWLAVLRLSLAKKVHFKSAFNNYV